MTRLMNKTNGSEVYGYLNLIINETNTNDVVVISVIYGGNEVETTFDWVFVVLVEFVVSWLTVSLTQVDDVRL